MGRFLKKVYFKWYEPVAVKRMRYRMDMPSSDDWKKLRRFQFLALLHVVGVTGLLSLLKGQNAPRQMPLWGVLLLGSAAGLVIAYFMPWLLTHTSSLAFVNEDGIYRSSGQSVRGWKFNRIKSCALSNVQIDDQRYDILLITDLDDRVHLLGLARKVAAEQLRSKLQELGVMITDSPAVVDQAGSQLDSNR